MNIIENIKKSWGWTGIDPEEIVGENEFGNLIIRDKDSQFWRLCPEDVYCQIIAKDRSELDVLSHDQEFLSDWYMSALVEQAKSSFGQLSSGQKYHLAIPGVLGGAYSIENIRTISQIEQIQFSGDIGQQIKDLPDGTRIKLNIID